jgi:taurine transport system substrate-binding protein
LVTSKQVANLGAPTFSAWIAAGAFAKANPDFLKAYAAVSEKYAQSFATNKAAWGADSDNAKLLAKFLGGKPADQAAALLNLSLLNPAAQATDVWLGGGEQSGIAKILKNTAVFLKDQKKISAVLPSYAAFVTPVAVTLLK